MEFGKLSEIENIDFSLPADAIRNGRMLKEKGNQDPTKIYVGMARWGERKLVGRLYPKATPSKDYLYHYSRQFNTIEMNTTHYRIPTKDMVAHWLDKSTDTFKFCPKIPQIISHSADYGAHAQAVEAFYQALYAFGSQLGLPFMQLPPTLEPFRQGKAFFDFLSQWPHDLPLAIELRHPAWFNDERIRERAYDLLEEYQLSTVITDTAGRRDVIHMQLTFPSVMVRFVGNSLHSTDYSRIDEWVKRLGVWLSQGLDELYFIVHQPEDLLCIDLAIYFIQRMNEKYQLNIPLPKLLSEGVQQSLF
ncbi:DUF72 domain-containing protein [Porifericola rhodea]|uniref:DUF72 domain-containing protein n=1 Tax=Porifericola rhodea TaxID=930972 RepID=UPI002665E7A5|nr:DUF72 domain-containing protein [Porifericola rhodea]WKN31653.1 DUF72 domain-containing protein [Porifericola rhodea]